MLTSDQINELVIKADILQKENPSLRKGQALMNILAEMDMPLYESVTGTEADCFYNDKLIPKFFEYLI